MRLRSSFGVFHALWLLTAASSCAAPRPQPKQVAPSATPAPLHRGPLSDLVPAASLRWLVLLKPHALLSEPELGPALAQLLTSRRLDAFTESSGVDLRAVPNAIVAGFPYATLYLAEVPAGVAATARDRFDDRLIAGATTKKPRPNLTRISGIVGQTPETLLSIDERVIAVAVGDPLLAKIAEAYAEERLKTSPSALHGSALSTLPELTSESPAVLFAPGPFSDEWRGAAGGLLQSAIALAATLQPIGHGKIAATIYLSGAWGESAEAAGRRLATAWSEFTQSSAGHLFQLDANGQVSATPELVTLRVELALEPLVQGLKAAVLSDVTDFLRAPKSAPSDTPGVTP